MFMTQKGRITVQCSRIDVNEKTGIRSVILHVHAHKHVHSQTVQTI